MLTLTILEHNTLTLAGDGDGWDYGDTGNCGGGGSLYG